MPSSIIVFIWKKNKKSVTRSKIISQHPKTFENANIVYIKLVTIEPQKTIVNNYIIKQLLMKVTLMMYLNQSIIQLYKTFKKKLIFD